MIDDAYFTHDSYRRILRTGLACGHRFRFFGEVDAAKAAGEKTCFLRHDCDNDLAAAADIARIEAEEGVRSTYFIMLRSALYNALAPTGAALIRRILAGGHRLGLHFDESVFATVDDAALVEQVDRERDLLGVEFGQAIDAVSFHQPGARILENRVRMHCFNTYDKRDTAGIHYTSDTNLAFRSGDPETLFKAGEHRLIQVLLHPEWWTAEAMALPAKWERMLANNLDGMQESLLAREATYRVRRQLAAAPAKAP